MNEHPDPETDMETLVIPTAPVELLPIPFEEMLAKLQIGLRHNVRNDRRQWRFVNPETYEWTAWQDGTRNLESFIRAEIKACKVQFTLGLKDKEGKLKLTTLGKEHFEEVVQAICHKKQVDPLLEWIESLPAWDETERVESMLETLFGVSEDVDPELAKWASRFPFIGVIERAKTPGASVQEVLVLVSKQGVGKSTFLGNLIPADLDAFGELNFSFDEGRKIEAVLGTSIVEVVEMGGSTSGKTSTEEIKGFISRTSDTWRLAYRPEPQKFKRRFVMIGTTNRVDSLPPDPTGNRRFVPIDLVGAKFQYQELLDWIEDNRDQLWAEALHMYNDGKRAALAEELKAAASVQAEGHRFVRSDTLEDAVQSLPAQQMAMVTIKEHLKKYFDDGYKMPNDNAIATTLRMFGWTRKNSGRPRMWTPPQGWGSEPFISDDDYEETERAGLAE